MGRFDGVMLSNGPGDPAENVEIIANLKKLLESNIPIFGICLGHQLLSLAIGAETCKLKYGHRGVNHPVKDLDVYKRQMWNRRWSSVRATPFLTSASVCCRMRGTIMLSSLISQPRTAFISAVSYTHLRFRHALVVLPADSGKSGKALRQVGGVVLVHHREPIRPVEFKFRHAGVVAPADLAHLLGREAVRDGQRAADGRAVGNDRDRAALVLPHQPAHPVQHALTGL